MSVSSSKVEDCAACPQSDCSLRGAALSRHVRGPYSGLALALLSALYFLVPVIFAMAGALSFHTSAVHQLLGGGGGLLFGMVLTSLLARKRRVDCIA